MEKDLLPLLEANKAELEEMLEKYEYLNKTHENLTEAIKKNIDTTHKFFNESDGIIEDIAVMTTSAKKDMIALNEAMAEQIALVKKINESMDEMSSKYNISKEKVAEVIPLLEQRAQLEKQIADMGDINADGRSADDIEQWFELSEALREVNQNIDKLGVGAKKMRKDFDDGDGNVKKLVKNTKDLENVTKNVTTAQSQYNKSMQTAIDKSNNFKKSGWFALLSTGWNILKKIGKGGFDKWREVDQAGRDFGRTMGMTTDQLKDHVSGILDNYGGMARKLGMEFKEMYKFQTGYAEATEKAVILTHEQVTSMAGLSRNTGEQAISVASKNLDVFATSADATIEYLTKGTARAAMEGLNVKKFSEAFANNIKMASKYTFKEGITGIQKMTLLSQRLKFNMESIGTAMDKFSTLEGALDAGAKLQVLGGSFAQNFGNPLEAMSEALLDGEAFTKRIIDTVANSAKFDSKTGELDLAPIDKQRLKAAANALGISYDELHNMATQSRKSEIISGAVKGKGLTEQQEAYLTNKAQYNKETGKWHLTDASGKMLEKDISQMSSEEISEAMGADTYEKVIASDVKGIHKWIVQNTSSQLSKIEDIKGREEQIMMAVANGIDALPEWLQKIINILVGMSMVSGVSSLLGNFGGRAGRRMSRLASRSSWLGRTVGMTKGGRLLRSTNVAWKAGMHGKNIAKLGNATKWSKVVNMGARGARYVVKPLSTVAKAGGKALGKVAVPLELALGGYAIYSAQKQFDEYAEQTKKDYTLNKKDRAKALADGHLQKSIQQWEDGIETGASATGAAIGSIFGPLGSAVGGALGWGVGALANLFGAGEALGKATAKSAEDYEKELEAAGIQDDLIESEGYMEMGEFAEDEEGKDVQEQVKNKVEKIGNTADSMNEKLSIIAQNSVNGAGNVQPNVNKPIKLDFQELKGKITLEVVATDGTSSSIDASEILKNPNLARGIVDIVQKSMVNTTGLPTYQRG